MIAIISLLMILYLSLLVNRLATIALTHTGMSDESARLQARSALSGCGFTTSESENMVIHPVRRRILLMMMLFGNVGVIATLASVILGFINNAAAYDNIRVKLAILIPGLILLWMMSNSKRFADLISSLFKRLLNASPDFQINDYIHLYHLDQEHKLAEIYIAVNHPCCNEPAALVAAHGLMLLGIRSSTGGYLSNPPPETIINENSCLIVYGHDRQIAELSPPDAI